MLRALAALRLALRLRISGHRKQGFQLLAVSNMLSATAMYAMHGPIPGTCQELRQEQLSDVDPKNIKGPRYNMIHGALLGTCHALRIKT